MANHLSYDLLSGLVEGRTSPVEGAKAQRHLARCPRCRSELAWLERIQPPPASGLYPGWKDTRRAPPPTGGHYTWPGLDGLPPSASGSGDTRRAQTGLPARPPSPYWMSVALSPGPLSHH